MSWSTTMIPIVRGMIFDLTPPYIYSCTKLEEFIVISATLVTQELTFSTSYTINLEAVTITPDPVDVGDEDFIALVALRTVCLISQGERRDAAKKAISVKDGPAFVDTKDRAKHLGSLAEDACASYSQAKTAYKIGDGSVGRSIIGPYSTYRTPGVGRSF